MKPISDEIDNIFSELYRPDYKPEDLKLAGLIKLKEEDLKIVEERVKEVEKKLFSSDAPVPLTEEEAIAIEAKVDEFKKAIADTRRRIAGIQSRIDAQLNDDGQVDMGFQLKLEDKERLAKAVKRTFGIRAEVITYSMYRAALKAKKEIEEREADNYTSGKWDG